MLIKTTIKTSKISNKKIESVAEFVSHNHDIAWQTGLDKSIPLNGKAENFKKLSAEPLFTYKIPKHDEGKTFHDYLLLGQQGAEYAGKLFPEAMDSPIDAMSLLVDSSDAFQKWTDPQSSHIESSLSTGKALISGFDLFEPYFPVFQQYNSHVKVAGLLLKIANDVYMINKEYEYKL